jgi:hyperosmotically inducible protein
MSLTEMPKKWLVALSLAIWSVACSQSDAAITTAIKEQLAADDEVKAYQIGVDTRDRIVTLSGTVGNALAKVQAAEIARSHRGVSRVIDNIAVTSAGPGPTSPDATLTAAVKTKLLAEKTISGRRIDVDARDSVVTLTGEVRSQAEKDIAAQTARDTAGVRDVIDRLVIVPQ